MSFVKQHMVIFFSFFQATIAELKKKCCEEFEVDQESYDLVDYFQLQVRPNGLMPSIELSNPLHALIPEIQIQCIFRKRAY